MGDVPDYKLFNDTKFTASSCICKNVFRECRARTTNNLALEFVFVTSVVEAHTLERSQSFGLVFLSGGLCRQFTKQPNYRKKIQFYPDKKRPLV
jgi:hypothetical protein